MPHCVVSTQKKTAEEGCFRAVFPRVLPGTGFIDRRRAELAGSIITSQSTGVLATALDRHFQFIDVAPGMAPLPILPVESSPERLT